MKKTIKSLFVLPVFIAAYLLDSGTHAIGPLFGYVDFIMIASVYALLSDREIDAFLFGCSAYVLLETVSMPVPGLYSFPAAAAFFCAVLLGGVLHKDKFSTKVFILAAACLVKAVFHVAAIWLYYWGGNFYFFSPAPLVGVAVTAAAGAVIYKAADFDYKGFIRWFNMKSAAK